MVFIKYTRQYQVDMRAKYFFYCHHCFLQDNIGNRTLCDISCESTRLGQFYTGKPTINKTRPRKHLSHSSLLIKRDYFLTHASCKSKNIWIRNQPLRYQFRVITWDFFAIAFLRQKYSLPQPLCFRWIFQFKDTHAQAKVKLYSAQNWCHLVQTNPSQNNKFVTLEVKTT